MIVRFEHECDGNCKHCWWSDRCPYTSYKKENDDKKEKGKRK